MNNYGFKIFWSEEDSAYIATCPEFPGLSAFGETVEDALREAKVALEMFIEDMQESGERLPAPQTAQRYSGQFRVRIARSLHRQLVEQAEAEGVSLNALVTSHLAMGVGASHAGERARVEHFTPQRAFTPLRSQIYRTSLETNTRSIPANEFTAETEPYLRQLISSVYRPDESRSRVNLQEIVLS